MKNLFKFLASKNGRMVRGVAGLVLVLLGFSSGNVVLIVLGLVPLAAGIFDFCVFAPLGKLPFSGKELRKKLGKGK